VKKSRAHAAGVREAATAVLEAEDFQPPCRPPRLAPTAGVARPQNQKFKRGALKNYRGNQKLNYKKVMIADAEIS